MKPTNRTCRDVASVLMDHAGSLPSADHGIDGMGQDDQNEFSALVLRWAESGEQEGPEAAALAAFCASRGLWHLLEGFAVARQGRRISSGMTGKGSRPSPGRREAAFWCGLHFSLAGREGKKLPLDRHGMMRWLSSVGITYPKHKVEELFSDLGISSALKDRRGYRGTV